MVAAGMATYPASLGGYRTVDARRYERRRYGSPIRRLNLRLTERAILRALGDVPAGGVVLDLPCGTGILHERLRERGLHVVAADLSPTMLAVARSRGEALGYVRADARHLPFGPGRFDAALCTRFLMHLDADARIATLRALAQITRGPVVATVCHPYTVKTAGRALRRFLGRKVKQSPRLTRAELDEELRRGDLKLTRLIPVAPILSEVWVVAVTAG